MRTKPRKFDARNSEVLRRAEADASSESASRAKPLKDGHSATSASDTLTASLTFFLGACICTFLFFANPYLFPFEAYRLVNNALLLWIPIMAIILFLKQDVQLFGMARGDKKIGLQYTLWAIVLMLPVLIVISLQPTFREYYGNSLAQPLAMIGYAVRPGFPNPLQPLGIAYYELGQGFYLFCWEFFFRGFLLFGLARARFLGSTGAIIVQAIPFALLHWSIVASASKPPIEIASALFGGLILGAFAIKTKSFFYGFLIHWAIAFILDMLIVVPMIAHNH